MKKLIILMSFILILIVVNVSYAAPFTTEQVMNKVLDDVAKALRVTATLSPGSTMEVTTAPFNTTILKRVTLVPNVDSGTALSFGTEVSKWTVLNVADTAEIFIKFETAATINDFKIPAGMGIAYDSKVTTIHAISQDTAEVEAIGLY